METFTLAFIYLGSYSKEHLGNTVLTAISACIPKLV